MRFCETCGKEHEGDYGSGRFCCSKCARSFSTKEKRSEINEKVRLTLKGTSRKHDPFSDKTPEEIKTIYEKQSATLRKTYKLKKEQFKKDHPFEEWKKSWIYEELFSNGNICQECGYEHTDPKTGKGPFDIHHKDGDNTNWKRENLEILCLICHWKTNNYRMKGKNHSEETKLKISQGLKSRNKNFK